MDVPQLSLQGGVGLKVQMTSQSAEVGGDDAGSASQTQIGTTLNGNPWDIFTGNIAALYYF